MNFNESTPSYNPNEQERIAHLQEALRTEQDQEKQKEMKVELIDLLEKQMEEELGQSTTHSPEAPLTLEPRDLSLEEQRSMLEKAVATLSEELERVKRNNPADFELFKQINGKLRANKTLLEEVDLLLTLKENPTGQGEAFDNDTTNEGKIRTRIDVHGQRNSPQDQERKTA